MAAMAAVTLALIGFFSFLMIQMTTPQMVPLFTDLAVDDSALRDFRQDRCAWRYDFRSEHQPSARAGRRTRPHHPEHRTGAGCARSPGPSGTATFLARQD
jgi:hypothetical protein